LWWQPKNNLFHTINQNPKASHHIKIDLNFSFSFESLLFVNFPGPLYQPYTDPSRNIMETKNEKPNITSHKKITKLSLSPQNSIIL
jgi:hypothetical protein